MTRVNKDWEPHIWTQCAPVNCKFCTFLGDLRVSCLRTSEEHNHFVGLYECLNKRSDHFGHVLRSHPLCDMAEKGG